MDDFLRFIEETKNFVLGFGIALTLLAVGGVAKTSVGGYLPRGVMVLGLLGLIVFLIGFSSSLLKFLVAHPDAFISDDHSSVRPNLAGSCALCFFSLCLFLYAAYVLVD